IFGSEEGPGAQVGVACFWATSLEKISAASSRSSHSGGWMQQSAVAEMCYPFGRQHGRHRVVKRRDFIALLGGAAAAWPLAARAEQLEPVRRVGLLMGVSDDQEAQARVTALKQGLQELRWIDGRNISIETRFAGGDADRIRTHATELVTLAPDV